jgi:N-acetylmuramic acid 6-phosphate etherase
VAFVFYLVIKGAFGISWAIIMPTDELIYTLGIEGGATRTSVILADSNDEVVTQFTAGPCNLRLMSQNDLEAHLRSISERLPRVPDTIGIGLAGVRLQADLEVLVAKVGRVWPGVPCTPSDDLMTAMEAVEWPEDCPTQILVLSGTGSCFLGRTRDGQELKIGGMGHVLGDRASACDIAQTALREVMAHYDNEEVWSSLGVGILSQLQLNDPEALIDWSLEANKTELASVAKTVFDTAREDKDPISLAVLDEAAVILATDAVALARRLDLSRTSVVQFLYNGGVLLKNPEFRKEVDRLILMEFPNAVLTPLTRASTWGAVELGRKALCSDGDCSIVGMKSGLSRKVGIHHSAELAEAERSFNAVDKLWKPADASPTEKRNPRSEELSKLSVADAIQLFVQEDKVIPDAIAEASSEIEWVIHAVVKAFERGGRLIYTGAGTSGRLGVLDASECPPTFKVPQDLVQGIMAGGRKALYAATEGSEDDVTAGVRAIRYRDVGENDVVIAISASGHAPFIWGCLDEAKERGATTVLLTCHPGYKEHPVPEKVIALDTGAELLTGSTRLKAGTATKMTLNLISTLAMVQTGKVISNLMVDLNPSNSKLRVRATGIVATLAEVSMEDAGRSLLEHGWNIREAVRSFDS